MTRSRLALLLFAATATLTAFAVTPAPAQKKNKKADPPPVAGKEPPATDPATMKVAKGFKVELLYSVPKDQKGSWVAMCTDPKGRLIVSDQYGPLYRVTPPPVGGNPADTKVEEVKAPIGHAQGLLWAFDALYVVVNDTAVKPFAPGLYRVTDSDNDDMPDKVELLREFEGNNRQLGEHGPHAVLKHPDGKRLTVVCGNQTKLMKYDSTRVPPVWGDDHLLPRLPDGNGFMKGVPGPGGAIYNVTPDGKNWELFSVGFRNQYDAAYNRYGDLFTYDADMEWDFNTPWYRPTRVCLVTSGSEFGWRNGAGKYPPHYPDSLPGILDIGPGSPTGVTFGHGAKFPAKYQDALFICDWSYGKLYAVHMKPKGAGYAAEAEEFVTGTPLPLTDLVVNEKDGAMYFAIGGRKTKSGLYRVTYTGSEPTSPVPPVKGDGGDGPGQRAPTDADRRWGMEQYHGRAITPEFHETLLRNLGTPDRFIRFAARTALEHQNRKLVSEMAFSASEPARALPALLALVRVSAPCPDHRKSGDPPADATLAAKVLDSLARVDFAKLDDQLRGDYLRVYHVLFHRFGMPTADQRSALLARLSPAFPTGKLTVDADLCQLLVYLNDPAVAAKGMAKLREAPTQEEQLAYLRDLRVLRAGWTPELRKEYFTWFLKAATFRGGKSLEGFLRLMKTDAVATLTPEEKVALKPVLDAKPEEAKIPEAPPRPLVKAYKLDDLAPKLDAGLKAGRDYERGRKMFAAAKCFGCHRFDTEGGSYGPDLTGIAGRFSPRDLLESVIDPSKEVSDQYGAVEIRTLDDRVVVGRIVNLKVDTVMVNTNMLDPGSTVDIARQNIDTMKPSKLSMMPTGLLDTLKEDEALDLLAYLLSRGDRNNAMFKK